MIGIFFQKIKHLLPEERNKIIEFVYCVDDPTRECFGVNASNIINDFFANIVLYFCRARSLEQVYVPIYDSSIYMHNSLSINSVTS